jgi:hypothetical protein
VLVGVFGGDAPSQDVIDAATAGGGAPDLFEPARINVLTLLQSDNFPRFTYSAGEVRTELLADPGSIMAEGVRDRSASEQAISRFSRKRVEYREDAEQPARHQKVGPFKKAG